MSERTKRVIERKKYKGISHCIDDWKEDKAKHYQDAKQGEHLLLMLTEYLEWASHKTYTLLWEGGLQCNST